MQTSSPGNPHVDNLHAARAKVRAAHAAIEQQSTELAGREYDKPWAVAPSGPSGVPPTPGGVDGPPSTP